MFSEPLLFDGKWQHDRHLSRLAAIFFRWLRSSGFQSQKRVTLVSPQSPVCILILHFHVICWSPRGSFLSGGGIESRAQYNRRVFALCKSCANERGLRSSIHYYRRSSELVTNTPSGTTRTSVIKHIHAMGAITQNPRYATMQQSWARCGTIYMSLQLQPNIRSAPQVLDSV